MKSDIAPLLWIGSLFCAATYAGPAVPLKSGDYTFQHRDAEFPSSRGFPVKVSIKGDRVVVTNPGAHGPIPAGVIEEATVMWHAKSRQWILGHHNSDRDAPEVGGCSGGPTVIDFRKRILWTCEGGP